jgi:secondary thiamine-phosphate synthase enzyme
MSLRTDKEMKMNSFTCSLASRVIFEGRAGEEWSRDGTLAVALGEMRSAPISLLVALDEAKSIWNNMNLISKQEPPMKTITVTTKKKDQIVDITETIETHLRDAKTEDGTCALFVSHTTCALTTADLDPGTDLDFLDVLRRMLPRISYRHPHDPSHTPDHILSSIIGPSLAIPYRNRQMLLGTWQRIVLVELDGPRQRTVHISFT